MKNTLKKLASYKDAPWSDDNVLHDGQNVVVYKDGFPVTELSLIHI